MSAAQFDHFSQLLNSEARGFFFLRHALAAHTTEQKLVSILNKAEEVYDRAVANLNLPSPQPYFNFVREGDKIKLLISREPSAVNEGVTLGEVILTPVIEPVHKSWIVALATHLPVPVRQLKELEMKQLLKEIELYYELLDICSGNLLCRAIKSFQETEQACAAVWRYDLSSNEHKLGLSATKDGKRQSLILIDFTL